MDKVEVKVNFEPNILKADSKNEIVATLSYTNKDSEKLFWCESDLVVKSPLTLARDISLSSGRARVGILKPNSGIEKKIKIYTLPNNLPDSYEVNITTYVYDEEAVISERIEQKEYLECV